MVQVKTHTGNRKMSDERRRYFRINDAIGVAYRKVDGQEAETLIKAAGDQNGGFDFVANFDNRIQTLLESCKIQSPLAAELLGLMNQKLNFVIQQMGIDAELINSFAYKMRQANISACGLAFANEEQLKVGQKLQLDIMLHPSEMRIACVAVVVGCDALEKTEDDLRYFLRLNFEGLSTTDQELMIQHVVQRQGVQLRVLQDQPDNENE
jgi:hypothetical protein